MVTTKYQESRSQKYELHVKMNVDDIRFTQKSINNTFSNGTPIEWTINMLKRNKIKPCEIPLIRVGFFNGHYKSIDNRRLYCYKTCNIKKIPVILMKEITKEFRYKDQSPNNGKSVQIINDPKSVQHHKNVVVAYNPMTKKCRTWTVKDIIAETKQLNKQIAISKKNVSNKGKASRLNNRNHKKNLKKTMWWKVNEKNTSNKVEIFVCVICKRRMCYNDKSAHLNGKQHKLKWEALKSANSVPLTNNQKKKPKINGSNKRKTSHLNKQQKPSEYEIFCCNLCNM
eukprot:102740_1